jgi:SRSO17 transposase
MTKKETHCVGVTRQYCGQLGAQDNCRVAVSISLATEHVSIPATYQLYLPEVWANDPERSKQAGVPGPLPPPPRGKMGRPPRLLRRDKQHQPLAAKELALCLTAAELRSVTWREGTRGSIAFPSNAT